MKWFHVYACGRFDVLVVVQVVFLHSGIKECEGNTTRRSGGLGRLMCDPIISRLHVLVRRRDSWSEPSRQRRHEESPFHRLFARTC